MVPAIEPCPVPSPKRGFQGKIKEASARVSLKTYTSNDLSVGGTRLILQEEIFLNRGKFGEIPGKASHRWTKTAI
jgi:hypothetical protein